MTNKKIWKLVLILSLSFLIFSSGCIKEEICWEHLSKPAPDELTCLEIATESFSKVCTDVFEDKDFCFELWENTEISFDTENKECIISLPVECGEKEK